MRRRALMLLALAPVLPGLAGCGAGDPTYYKLAAVPGTPPPGDAPRSVEVHTPTVAPFLDRDYIVSKTEDYQLTLAGNRAWAEPIGDMIGRVLAADIAERLPRSNVYVQGSVVAAADPAATVSFDVTRFDLDADGQAVVEGHLAVRAAGVAAFGPTVQPISLRTRPAGPSTGDMVAALSAMLGEVADLAAGRLVRLGAATAFAPTDGA